MEGEIPWLPWGWKRRRDTLATLATLGMEKTRDRLATLATRGMRIVWVLVTRCLVVRWLYHEEEKILCVRDAHPVPLPLVSSSDMVVIKKKRFCASETHALCRCLWCLVVRWLCHKEEKILCVRDACPVPLPLVSSSDMIVMCIQDACPVPLPLVSEMYTLYICSLPSAFRQRSCHMSCVTHDCHIMSHVTGGNAYVRW